MRCRFEQSSAVGVIEQPRACVAVGRAPVDRLSRLRQPGAGWIEIFDADTTIDDGLVLLRNCGTLTWPSPCGCLKPCTQPLTCCFAADRRRA